MPQECRVRVNPALEIIYESTRYTSFARHVDETGIVRNLLARHGLRDIQASSCLLETLSPQQSRMSG